MMRPDQRECDLCDLHKTRTNVVVADDAIRKCGIAIIGEAPGKDEDESSVPFVGKSGSKLRQYLYKYGKIKLGSNAIVLNTVSCRPPDNRQPTNREREACSNWLKLNLKIIDPRLVLAVGKVSADTFLETAYGPGVFYSHEYFNEGYENFKFDVFNIWHPSYLLRNGMKQDMLVPWIKWIKIFSMKARNLNLI